MNILSVLKIGINIQANLRNAKQMCVAGGDWIGLGVMVCVVCWKVLAGCGW